MDVVSDIKENFRCINLYHPYEPLLELVKDFEFGMEEKVNTFALCGDLEKYAVKYRIGDYSFYYEHICSDRIDSAMFIIKSDQSEKEENIFIYSTNAIRLGIELDLPKNCVLYRSFMKEYPILLGNHSTFFNILNAFTIGCCVTFRRDTLTPMNISTLVNMVKR